MRILANFYKENLAKRLSYFLKKEQIDNRLEENFDEKINKTLFNIWVVNEDDLTVAKSIYDNFITDPNNKRFDIGEAFLQENENISEDSINKPSTNNSTPNETQLNENKFKNHLLNNNKEDIDRNDINSNLNQSTKNDNSDNNNSSSRLKGSPNSANNIKGSFSHRLTFLVLFLCISLYFIDSIQSATVKKKYNLKEMVLLTPLQIQLLYDYPKARILTKELIIKFKLDTVKKLKNPPIEAEEELEKIEKYPSWVGFYDIILNKITKKPNIQPLLFEKIRQGQIWRFVTPIFLHGGLLHILFNMLWLWYLGKQIEPRLGFFKYLLFILIIGALSNTAQYLMGGPFFLGYSGVIMGMIGYIFVRQKIAPWEGYNIPNGVYYFIGIFIIATVFLGFSTFIYQIVKPKTNFFMNIANTAHISGALFGMLLAKIPFFSKR